MHGMRLISALTIMLVIAFNAAAGGDARRIAPKPQTPLSVAIEPQNGGSAAEVPPGQVVELRIVVRSLIDQPAVSVFVSASGGAEIIAGETSWSGPLQGNATRAWNISARATQKGAGKIIVRAEEGTGSKGPFRSEAVYELGKNPGKKPAAGSRVKDRQGRDVIEYEVK